MGWQSQRVRQKEWLLRQQWWGSGVGLYSLAVLYTNMHIMRQYMKKKVVRWCYNKHALFPLQSDAKHVLFSSSMQEFIRVYVSGLAKSHHPWFRSSAFKLPGMTILRWTLIQESSFYPSYLCRTRKRRLDEEKDGIFLYFFLCTHLFFTVTVCIL